MTSLIEAEPQPQPQGAPPPPGTPKRTAVGTDDGEKRPCRHCGHTQAAHLGPKCSGLTGFATGETPRGTFTMGSWPCPCTVYEPKED